MMENASMPVVLPHVTPTTGAPTASTNVNIQPVAEKKMNQMEALGWIGGILVAIIIGLERVGSFVKMVSEFIEKKRNGDASRTAPLEGRVKDLEDQAKTFKPAEYIDREILGVKQLVDHEKANRQTVTNNLGENLRKVEKALSDEAAARGKLEAKVEGLGSSMDKLEEIMKETRTRLDERFDKLSDQLTDLITKRSA